DRHGLSQLIGQPEADVARDEIGRGTRAERDDHAQRLGRVLRGRKRRVPKQDGGNNARQANPWVHLHFLPGHTRIIPGMRTSMSFRMAALSLLGVVAACKPPAPEVIVVPPKVAEAAPVLPAAQAHERSALCAKATGDRFRRDWKE